MHLTAVMSIERGYSFFVCCSRLADVLEQGILEEACVRCRLKKNIAYLN